MTTMTVPTKPEELEDLLSDQSKVQALIQNGQFGELIKNYAQNVMNKDQDLGRQVKEQVQAEMAQFFKENKNALNGAANKLDLNVAARAGSAASTQLNNKRANGAPADGLWSDFTSFLQDVHNFKRGEASDDANEKIKQLRAYSEKIPSEGGFLVPEEFRSEMLQLALDSSVVRPRASVFPMASPRLHVPMVDETSRVSSIYGGLIVYRTEEGAELTESSAAYASLKLDVTKQTALAHVPNELVRDWGAFTNWINTNLPQAMAQFEDWDFLSGNGVGAPLGALHASNTAIITVAAETGQSAATNNQIVWLNVVKMFGRLLPSSYNTAVWVASPDTFAQLATMALEIGTGGSAVWLTDGRAQPVLTLLGRPVLLTGSAPAALGTQGDLSLVDFKMYAVGDYQTLTVDSSPHVKFTSDKTTFRAIARNDGRPLLNSPLTPHNNSATLSPFVQLASRP